MSHNFFWRFISILLLAVLCWTPLTARAQAPVEFVLYVDVDTLTVYIPGNQIISLQGFGFEVTVNGQARSYALAAYPAFGIPFDRLPTPICFRLERDGTSRALPLDCQGKMTLIQRLPDADVFWYDISANQERVFQVVQGITPLGFCGAGQAQCNLTYTPPEFTPAPATPEPPTPDPVNAAMTQIAAGWTPTPPLDLTATAQQALVYAMATLTGAAPTRDPFMPVAHNTDWTPVIQSFDGVDMVLVPAGCFLMGENGQGGQQCFDKPFWIGRTEVTNAQYKQCVDVGGCTPPGDTIYYDDLAYTDHPVVYVDWFQASDYAHWRGGRLPTEAEWEYAARGPDGLVYPWGNDFVGDNVVWNTDRTAPVGSRPDGVSWVGALDMSGNVWEWMSSLYGNYPYVGGDGREDLTDSNRARVMRGGSENTPDRLRSDYRITYLPNNESDFRGFRCVRDY